MYFKYLKLLVISVLITNIQASEIEPTKEEVAKLYVATFNRAPDSGGLDYWVNSSGLKLSEIAQSFFEQTETQELYPSTITNRDFISRVYQNLFNRVPDNAGWDYWEAELDANRFSKNRFIEAVINGAQGQDATILDNKNAVGLYFANVGLDNRDNAKSIMEDITHEDTTVNKSLSIIANYVITSLFYKSLTNIHYSEVFGAEKENLVFNFTNNQVNGKYEGNSISATYEIIDGILKVTFSDGSIDYNKILNISSDTVSVCANSNGLEDVKNCSNPTSFWVTTATADSFVIDKNSSADIILKNKILITEFDEIKNQLFYKADAWKTDERNRYNLSALKIENNNRVYAGYIGASYYKTDTPATYINFIYNGVSRIENGLASFSNNSLTITGDIDNYNGGLDPYDIASKVYKYDLSGITMKVNKLGEIFDQEGYDVFTTETVTFTNGILYCTLLSESCWVDVNAIKPINEFLRQSNLIE